jgi:hypothetical protein
VAERLFEYRAELVQRVVHRQAKVAVRGSDVGVAELVLVSSGPVPGPNLFHLENPVTSFLIGDQANCVIRPSWGGCAWAGISMFKPLKIAERGDNAWDAWRGVEALDQARDAKRATTGLARLPMVGARMSESEALDTGIDFLGPGGYRDMGRGRFLSEDGLRQFRMGPGELNGTHGGGPRVNFETLGPNLARPGRMQVQSNSHVYLD